MRKHVKISAASCIDMINAFNTRLMELDPTQVEGSECHNCNDPQEVIEGADDYSGQFSEGDAGINDQYISDLMSYVADETASDDANPRVCTWRTEDGNIIFVLTGLNEETIEEFTCPISDLTGNIDDDMTYILDATNGEEGIV